MKIKSKDVTLKNGKTISLRSVTAKDAENMLAHLVITHSEAPQNMNQGAEFWKSFSVEQEKAILEDFELSDTKFMIAATYQERIIGGLGFTASPGHYHRKNGSLGMSIQQEFANLGLGTHLMNLAMETAKQMGFHRMELTVRTFNQPGIALYEKVGFKRIGKMREIAFIEDQYFDEYAYELLL